MITDTMVAAAVAAHDAALSATVECPRCEGRGYHHGFGEHGHDPDWCEKCGGPGLIPAHTAESAMRIALEATISSAYRSTATGE